jgi:NADH dehydrogenase [ubiquinone] 1 alpha subcomplex assembly factor 7
MTPLEAHIRAQIAAQGPLSLANYMELALAHPEHGYYTTRQPFGRGGDFTTAPEISQAFGELIGLFFADYWLGIGEPAPIHLIELGPGRGTLMKDALRALNIVPEFRRALEVSFVEISPVLKKLQAAAVPEANTCEALDDVPAGPSFILANEFFDALPIRQFVKRGYGWLERKVGLRDGRLALVEEDSPTSVAPPGAGAKEGDIFEACPQAALWIGSIAARLNAGGGLALILDYGCAAPAFGDTLQAVKAHAPADPLTTPGEADLTAHVNFAALIDHARQAGLNAFGPLPQGEFLTRLGIGHRKAQLLKDATPAQAREIESAIERLTAPGQMGELFKALALTGRASPPPEGFPVAG